MTVTSTTNKATYSGDGVTTSFAFSFRILDEDDLTIKIKDSNGNISTKTITTHYTVSGSGNDSGRTNYTSGNVVFTAGNIPSATDTVIILREIEATQESNYPRNSRFPSATVEEDFDKLTMLSQQLEEELERSVKLDAGVTGFDATLPTPVSNGFIKFNSAGTALDVSTLASVSTGLLAVVQDTTPQLGGALDCNAYNIEFDDNTGICDDASNEQLIFQKTSNAVNHYEMTNSATGTSPLIKAVGTDTNVDFRAAPQGSGTVRLEGTVVVPDEIQHDADTNNKIGFTTDTQTFTTGGSTRMDITDSGVQLGGSGARVTTVLDEDTLSSDSATALATQQSIKAYVDSFESERAKAWCSLNGTGTPAFNAQYNFASIVDNGTGDYTLNLTTAFSSANFASVYGAGTATRTVRTVSKTTSSVRIQSFDSTPTISDDPDLGVALFGAQ